MAPSLALTAVRALAAGAIATLAIATAGAAAPSGAAEAPGARAEQPASAHARQDARPRIQVTNPIRVGARVRFRLSGFAPGARVSASLQPKSAEGSNGVGRRLFNRRANRSGVLVVRMRFPRSYFICSGGAGPCGAYPFKNGERVLISAVAGNDFTSVTRRLIVPNRR